MIGLSARPEMQKPMPPTFPLTFVTQGYRGIERLFGNRSEVHQRWLNDFGRKELEAARLRYRRGELSAAEPYRAMAERASVAASRAAE